MITSHRQLEAETGPQAAASGSTASAEGLFATEGEDLLEAGLAAGAEPKFVLVAAGSGVEAGPSGEEVEPELLAGVSGLGSGTRAIAVWGRPGPTAGDGAVAAPCLYLRGVSDPGNVGAIVRTADALLGGTVALGPDCADPYSPKALRASMGSIFSAAAGPSRRAADSTPAPRVALVAHGGEAGLEALDRGGDPLPRRRARGAAGRRFSPPATRPATIPLFARGPPSR